MRTIASPITSLTVVYSTVYSDADQRKHQRSATLAFVWGIHRDRWIPRTKGQLRGKCFHLMTSSWNHSIIKLQNTVRCHYNMVQYCKILYKYLQKLSRILVRCWTTKDTPYLALTGELWCVFCKYLWENWLLYNDTALHYERFQLTHWGRATHICVNKLTIIASDNGLLPVRRQAIIWTNAGILLIGPLVTNFSEILIEI